jgi:hypothetical protein
LLEELQSVTDRHRRKEKAKKKRIR